MMPQHGGSVYGQGLHGATMDVDPRPGDTDTLHAHLSRPESVGSAWVAYFMHVPRGNKRPGSSSSSSRQGGEVQAQEVRVAPGSGLAEDIMHSLHKPGYIAKRFVNSVTSTARQAFDYELKTNLRVMAAYGADADRLTTLGPLELDRSNKQLLALRVVDTRACFVLSRRCGPDLEKFDFSRQPHMSEATAVHAFVSDILEGLSRLHDAGLLHADLKLDNMIYCAPGSNAPKSRGRFKLIDWGRTSPVACVVSPRAQVLGNSASPLIWYMYGVGEQSTVPMLLRLANIYPVAFMTSLTYQKHTLESVLSFQRLIDRLLGEAGGDEHAVRRRIAREYAASFDLYNLGLSLAMLADSAVVRTARVRRLLGTMAAHLMRFDVEGFVGNDARAALRHWTLLQRHG